MQYYVSINNIQQGPYAENELRSKIESGEIPQEGTLYWKEGMADWIPLANFINGTPPPIAAHNAGYNLINSLTSCMSRYAMFDGRASRSEFWFFSLACFIIGLIPYIDIVWSLASLIPSIAVVIRRMHDVGKCGWFCLIPIYSLILCCMPSDGPNQYGHAPLPPTK